MSDRVEIKGFKPEFLELADIREHEQSGILTVPGMLENLGEIVKRGQAMTMLVDGRIVAFAGYFEIWLGVCEVWILPTKHVQKHVRQFSKTMKHYLDTTMILFKMRRAQTAALDDDLHNRWMHWMGFEKEGMMREYSVKGQNYNMWAKIYKGGT